MGAQDAAPGELASELRGGEISRDGVDHSAAEPGAVVVFRRDSGRLQLVAEINATHRLALASRDDAVRSAIRCGELLLGQKKQLAHGDFGPWLEMHCEFKRSTAARYMAAAQQFLRGVEVSSLSSIFRSGQRTRTTLLASAAALETPRQQAPELMAANATAEHALERAIAALKPHAGAPRYRRVLDAERAARRVLKQAEIAHRNAVARLIAAAALVAPEASL